MLTCFSLSLRNKAIFHTDAVANITSWIRLKKNIIGCREKKSYPGSLVYCSHQNQTDCKMHLPSAVPVVLADIAILGQGGGAEPEGWDALVVAVPLISIVTVETSHESIAVPSTRVSSGF